MRLLLVALTMLSSAFAGPPPNIVLILAGDPGETRDVAARHPEIVARVRKTLADARAPKKQRESRPRPEVWMVSPASPDGPCFRDLFTHPETWIFRTR